MWMVLVVGKDKVKSYDGAAESEELWRIPYSASDIDIF